MLSAARVLARLGIASLSLAATACGGVQYFLANAPARFGSYNRSANLRYGEDARQRLDVYAPSKANNRPVVIFWYGGSWLSGTKANYRFVGAALAQRGFVTVLPDYRLYPAVKFPLFMDDAAHAVAWVQQHAAEFGGDPHRIVLMGHSAGAHMAAFLAYNSTFLERAGAHPQWIKGLIGLSGPYALEPNSEVLHAIFANPYTMADWQPIRFVSEHSPPTLLFHGTPDKVVTERHAEVLRDALKAHHVPVEADLLPGRGHADTVAAFAFGARYRAPVLEKSVRFIESVSGERPALQTSSSLGQPQTDPSP
jgi:acetyl esterase/lipase